MFRNSSITPFSGKAILSDEDICCIWPSLRPSDVKMHRSALTWAKSVFKMHQRVLRTPQEAFRTLRRVDQEERRSRISFEFLNAETFEEQDANIQPFVSSQAGLNASATYDWPSIAPLQDESRFITSRPQFESRPTDHPMAMNTQPQLLNISDNLQSIPTTKNVDDGKRQRGTDDEGNIDDDMEHKNNKKARGILNVLPYNEDKSVIDLISEDDDKANDEYGCIAAAQPSLLPLNIKTEKPHDDDVWRTPSSVLSVINPSLSSSSTSTAPSPPTNSIPELNQSYLHPFQTHPGKYSEARDKKRMDNPRLEGGFLRPVRFDAALRIVENRKRSRGVESQSDLNHRDDTGLPLSSISRLNDSRSSTRSKNKPNAQASTTWMRTIGDPSLPRIMTLDDALRVLRFEFFEDLKKQRWRGHRGGPFREWSARGKSIGNDEVRRIGESVDAKITEDERGEEKDERKMRGLSSNTEFQQPFVSLLSQILTLVPDRTTLERELDAKRRSCSIWILNLATHAAMSLGEFQHGLWSGSDFCIISTRDFCEIIRTVARHEDDNVMSSKSPTATQSSLGREDLITSNQPPPNAFSYAANNFIREVVEEAQSLYTYTITHCDLIRSLEKGAAYSDFNSSPQTVQTLNAPPKMRSDRKTDILKPSKSKDRPTSCEDQIALLLRMGCLLRCNVSEVDCGDSAKTFPRSDVFGSKAPIPLNPKSYPPNYNYNSNSNSNSNHNHNYNRLSHSSNYSMSHHRHGRTPTTPFLAQPPKPLQNTAGSTLLPSLDGTPRSITTPMTTVAYPEGRTIPGSGGILTALYDGSSQEGKSKTDMTYLIAIPGTGKMVSSVREGRRELMAWIRKRNPAEAKESIVLGDTLPPPITEGCYGTSSWFQSHGLRQEECGDQESRENRDGRHNTHSEGLYPSSMIDTNKDSNQRARVKAESRGGLMLRKSCMHARFHLRDCLGKGLIKRVMVGNTFVLKLDV